MPQHFPIKIMGLVIFSKTDATSKWDVSKHTNQARVLTIGLGGGVVTPSPKSKISKQFSKQRSLFYTNRDFTVSLTDKVVSLPDKPTL